MQQYRRYIDEPNMSDKTLLMSVEDLISHAFGTADLNLVNFKLVQTVLYILARQMRLLEQGVEIKFDEVGVEWNKTDDGTQETGRDREEQHMTSSSSGSREEAAGRVEKDDRGGDRGGGKGGGRDKRGEKTTSKDRDERGGSKNRDDRGRSKDKDDRGASKDRDRAEKSTKEKKGDKGGSKEKGGEKSSSKERKGDKDGTKEKGSDRGGSKERDKGKEGERGADRDDDQDGDRGGGRDDDRGGSRRKDRDDLGGGQRKDRAEKDEEGGKKRDGDREADRDGDRDAERKGERKGEKRGERKGRGQQEQGERSAERGADRKGTPESGRSVAGSQKGGGREGSRTSITVTEAERKGGKGAQDKILVVGTGPSTRTDGRVARVGSIEVVTASQFALLEKAVKQLMTVAGPLPMPVLPDNEKLRKDLVKGTASLTDTMQAMQLNARVLAAEQGLARMAGLLTQLAAAGALPQDVAGRLTEVRAGLQQAAGAASAASAATKDASTAARTGGTGAAGPGGQTGGGRSSDTTVTRRKSVAIDPVSTLTSGSSRPDSMKRGGAEATSGTTVQASVAGRASVVSGISTGVSTGAGTAVPVGVTHPEMEDVLQIMKDDLIKEITSMTYRASHSADVASSTSKSVADKLEIAIKLDKRITKLFSQTVDYAEQLSGFDSGLTTQMASFQEQMSQMRTDLNAGLSQLEQANNNAETAAIVELTERYEGLVIELDNTLHVHQSLTALQKQLSDELRSLVECVEMLREQKADRDEVFDGLRDKADISRLAGLLHEVDFAFARAELEKRLETCYDKFKRQDQVWLSALKDLTGITEGKAEMMQLLTIKDTATAELQNIQATLRKLYIMLGEPKAAVLTRLLAKGAVCGSCLAPALMDPLDLNYGKPFPLPELRPPLLGEEACLTQLKPLPPPDERQHVCRRWVGGSHTLMADHVTREKDHVTREKAPATQLQTTPTKRYTGYGTDGRLYMLEEELLPCLECNKLSTDEPGAISTPMPTPTGGGGDQGRGQHITEPGGDDKGDKK